MSFFVQPCCGFSFPICFPFFGKSLNNRIKNIFKFGGISNLKPKVLSSLWDMRAVWTVWEENVAVNFYVTHVNGTKCFVYIGKKEIIAT